MKPVQVLRQFHESVVVSITAPADTIKYLSRLYPEIEEEDIRQKVSIR